MALDKDFIAAKLSRFEMSDGGFCWCYQRNIYESEPEEIFWYDYTIPEENGAPSPQALDYLLKILNNFDEVQQKAKIFIKAHLSIQSDFSLQKILILEKPDKHETEATLHFWCDEDGYLYTEIGLMELRPHYLLIKYW